MLLDAFYAYSVVDLIEDVIVVANGEFNLTQSVNHQMTFVTQDTGTSYNWLPTFNTAAYKTISGNIPIGLDRTFSGGLSSCLQGVGPGYHFSSIQYDPTLASIFTLAAPTPGNSKPNVPLIVGLTVSLGGTVIIVTVIVLLALFVPQFKFLMRPFARPQTIAGRSITS